MALNDVNAWIADMKKCLSDFEQECIESTKTAARCVTKNMMERTPVWSGRTVRNFQWSVGDSAPSGGEIEPSGTTSKSTPTGNLELGAEPNRAENESAALSDMESVLDGVTKLQNLSVANNSPTWDLVDNGSAPTADRARNPGGVSELAIQATISELGEAFK